MHRDSGLQTDAVMLEHSHALRASKGHFSISEYFLPFSPSLTRRGYLSLPKACQILLREVSDLIDGAGLVRRPSYSLFRAIILLPSLPWQIEDGLLALFYIFKFCFQALHPLFHLPCPKNIQNRCTPSREFHDTKVRLEKTSPRGH